MGSIDFAVPTEDMVKIYVIKLTRDLIRTTARGLSLGKGPTLQRLHRSLVFRFIFQTSVVRHDKDGDRQHPERLGLLVFAD